MNDDYSPSSNVALKSAYQKYEQKNSVDDYSAKQITSNLSKISIDTKTFEEQVLDEFNISIEQIHLLIKNHIK